MNINITVRNSEVSQETKDYIEEKVQKLNKYAVRRVETIATKDAQNQYKIEIVASPERGNAVVGNAKASEWFGAIDQALDKVERQLRKIKEKSKSHRVKKYIPEPEDDGDDMIMHY